MEASAVLSPGAGRTAFGGRLLRFRSDDQLVALFRLGDDEAFRVIHDRYQQRLFAYIRRMLAGSRPDAEDALQDVFVRAYSALRGDDRPVTLRAWLYRVAHNRCIDELRRPVPRPLEVLDVSRGPELYDPLERAQRRDDLRRLVADVRRLPEQQRSALLMRELDGLSYVELADALAVTVPAVKSLLVRARIGLVEAGAARDAACADIRRDIAEAAEQHVRCSGRARRHLQDCLPCRRFREGLRATSASLAGLSGPPGLLAGLGTLLGAGAAGGGAAAAGGGAAAAGTALGSATAVKVAALVCTVAVVGGGAVVHETAERGPARHTAAAAAPAAPAAAGREPLAPAVLATRIEPRTVRDGRGPAGAGAAAARERPRAARRPHAGTQTAPPAVLDGASGGVTVPDEQDLPPAIVGAGGISAPADADAGLAADDASAAGPATAAPGTGGTPDAVASARGLLGPGPDGEHGTAAEGSGGTRAETLSGLRARRAHPDRRPSRGRRAGAATRSGRDGG